MSDCNKDKDNKIVEDILNNNKETLDYLAFALDTMLTEIKLNNRSLKTLVERETDRRRRRGDSSKHHRQKVSITGACGRKYTGVLKGVKFAGQNPHIIVNGTKDIRHDPLRNMEEGRFGMLAIPPPYPGTSNCFTIFIVVVMMVLFCIVYIN